jgi:hypothetical protein
VFFISFIKNSFIYLTYDHALINVGTIGGGAAKSKMEDTHYSSKCQLRVLILWKQISYMPGGGAWGSSCCAFFFPGV